MHVSTCMEHEIAIKRSSQPVRRGVEQQRGKEKRKERKKKKRKRKRERGRRSVVSSSVHWRSNSQNSLDQGVNFGDSTRGYASRGRDSSYFGLFLAFGILFLADFGTMLCHVNGMGWICSRFKGLLPERIYGENLHLWELPKCSCNPRARYCMDWRNSVAHSVLQLRTTISFSFEL